MDINSLSSNMMLDNFGYNSSLDNIMNRSLNQANKNSETKNIDNTPKAKQLKKACQEFESLLTEKIMKQGLEAASKIDDEEEENGSKMFKELANEQLSRCVGKSGMLNLAEQLYQVAKKSL